MKYYLTALLSVLSFFYAIGQEETYKHVDSLKRELGRAKQDTSRVLLMAKLGEAYRATRPDTALLYANEALALTQKIKYPKGEIHAILLLSVLHRELGNLPEALQLALKALRLSQENHYALGESLSFARIANTYLSAKNLSKALFYLKEADKKLQDSPNIFFWSVTHLFMAEVYSNLNKLDSAEYELNLINQKNPSFAEETGYAFLMGLGELAAKKGNISHALSYFKEAVRQSLDQKNYRYAASGFTRIASLYKGLKKQDSAIYHAKEGLKYAQLLSYQNRILAPGQLLAELYEPIDIKESLRYHKMASAAKDSLYGADKVQKLQSMTMEEQERQNKLEAERIAYQNEVRQYGLLGGIAVFVVIAIMLFRNNRQKQKANELLKKQKQELDEQRSRAEEALKKLKTTQSQLIQSEKMASLGELTAGIAHEIQNPLNFVNNFSDVNTELVEELQQEAEKGNIDEVKAIAKNLKENEQKINHHGKRADAIVQGMLQHSRKSTGQKEPTDINALVDEYLRLSYHGLRVKDKTFNATFKTNFDYSIEKVDVVPQDIGRVLLNLLNNAFYSVNEKKKAPALNGENYEPTVWIITKRISSPPDGEVGGLQITVKDNGVGIPQKVLNKIYQPFFTTKPTGEGTGLGLSLSYDIITKGHGGEMKVETKEGEGAEFIIELPV